MTNQTNNQGGVIDVDDAQQRNVVQTGVKRKGNKLVTTLFASLAGLIAFAGIAMTVFNFDEQEAPVEVKQDEALKEQGYNQNTLASQMAEIKRQQEEEERLRKEAEERERLRREQEERDRLAQQQEEAQVTAIVTGQQAIVEQEQGERPLTPAERRLQGETLVQLENKDSTRNSGENTDKINDMLQGGTYAKGSAKMVNGRDLLLIHGTQIPCALQTRLVTDQPSILICQITKDIFSADGSTLLVERGSKVFGEQKNAIITGQNMAFVNWSEIDTPNGIRVRIDSLGTDSLGASGMNVWVDEKWGKRFGGAILLSFIQDSLATASNAASKRSNGSIVYDNSEANTGRMAEIALENSINIQPTGYANQGQLFNILVARDIDFSSIYRVK